MVTRVIALLCALVLFVPMAASAAEFQAFFPAGSNFVADILTSNSIDGVHHQHLGINLNNLDLFAVTMLSSGTPDAPSGRPWLYGKIALVQQLDAHTFRVTWNVSTSANGVSFTPVGTIVITFVV
jgi:hypothetical protein